MHESNYTFNGTANIGGLTPDELSMLQLGYHVRQEQHQRQADNQRRGRRYTEPRRTTDEAMREFADRSIH